MLRPGQYVLILTVLGLTWLIAVVGGRWERFSQHWYEPVGPARNGSSEPDDIHRVAYAEGQVWVLTDGGLWTIDPVAARARPTGVAAQDICIHDGGLTIITESASRPVRWTIETRRAGAWHGVAEVESGGDGLVGLDCGSELRVLTSRRLITLGRGGATMVKLSERVPALPPSVLRSTPDHLLVGVSAGEWGGALLRIDQRTGQVKELAHDGPPQINAITSVPRRPHCALVSAGDRRSWAGALLEVCGEQVGAIVSRECATWPCDAGYYSVADLGSEVLVTTVGGLYRVLGDGAVAAAGTPSFSQAGPFQVSVGGSYILLRAPVDERFHPGGSDAVVIDIRSRDDGA